MSAPRELPLFPLATVLFPGGPLPLRIFEPRYVDMVGRCLRGGSGFGVVLLTAGGEAGAEDSIEFAAVGTEARIVDFDRLEDGLLGLACVGRERIRVLEAWRQPDGLNVALVEDLPPDERLAVPDDCAHMAELLRRLLPELADLYAHVERRFEHADWVASRLAELLPLELADKQSLLETADPAARLAALAPALRRPGH